MAIPPSQMSKSDCVLELSQRNFPMKASLSVIELRALVKESRVEEGLACNSCPMVSFRKMQKAELVEACLERSIVMKSGATVGDMLLALRDWYINSGSDDAELDFGRHKGLTYRQVLAKHQQYVANSMQVYKVTEDCPLQLERFVRWCLKESSQCQALEADKPQAVQKLQEAIAALGEAIQCMTIHGQPVEPTSSTAQSSSDWHLC